jgi:hypothetical protein
MCCGAPVDTGTPVRDQSHIHGIAVTRLTVVASSQSSTFKVNVEIETLISGDRVAVSNQSWMLVGRETPQLREGYHGEHVFQ